MLPRFYFACIYSPPLSPAEMAEDVEEEAVDVTAVPFGSSDEEAGDTGESGEEEGEEGGKGRNGEEGEEEDGEAEGEDEDEEDGKDGAAANHAGVCVSCVC